MKASLPRVLVLAFGLLTLGTASAQTAVPNGSLETWQAKAGYESPQGWQTSDDLLADSGIPIPLQTVSKSTESASGQFAARLQAKALFGAAIVPGIMVLGRITDQDSDVTGGIPYTGRPTQLQFRYKFPGLVSDSAFAIVSLTRGNLSTPGGEVIGQGGTYFLGNVNTFRLGSVPIQYASANPPDTLRIFFLMGITTGAPSPAAAFFLDDLAMSFAPLAAQEPIAAATPALQVAPNPSATGEFVLISERRPALLTGSFTVLDARGRTVLTEPAIAPSAAQNRTVRLQGQPAGLYWLRLESAQGSIVQKLLIQ